MLLQHSSHYTLTGGCLHLYPFSVIKLNKSGASFYWATVALFANAHLGMFQQFKIIPLLSFTHFFLSLLQSMTAEMLPRCIFIFSLELEKSEENWILNDGSKMTETDEIHWVWSKCYPSSQAAFYRYCSIKKIDLLFSNL